MRNAEETVVQLLLDQNVLGVAVQLLHPRRHPVDKYKLHHLLNGLGLEEGSGGRIPQAAAERTLDLQRVALAEILVVLVAEKILGKFAHDPIDEGVDVLGGLALEDLLHVGLGDYILPSFSVSSVERELYLLLDYR